MGLEDLAQFGLELVDKISQPAKSGATQIELIAQKLKKTQKLASLTSRDLGVVARHFAFKGAAAGIDRMAKGFAYTAAGAVATATAFGGFAAKSLVQGVTGMAMFAETTRRGYGYLLHSQAKGNAAFETASKLSRELGMDIKHVGQELQHMLAMQFTVGEATDLIKLSQDLQAIGSSADQAKRALLAITQIKAKGKLQAEELVGQLAEAGVSTVLVYQSLAKQLSKTEQQVKDLLGKGKITADMGIKAIKSAIMTKVGEKSPGEAAAGFMSSTLTGALQRLQTLPNQLFMRMADNIGPAALKRISATVATLTKQIESMDTSGFERFVTTAFNLFEAIAPLAKEMLQGFGDEFAGAMTELKLALSPASLERARSIGRGIAQIVKGVMWTLDKIASLVSFLSTPAGQWTAKLLLASVVVGKLLTSFVRLREVMIGLKAAKGVAELAEPVAKYALPKFGAEFATTAAGTAAGRAAGGAAGGAAAGAAGGAAAGAGWFTRMVVGIGAAAKAAGAAIAGASIATIGAVAGAVASLGFLGYTIWKNWDELVASFKWLFSNIGTAFMDFAKSMLKWVLRFATGGVSSVFEAGLFGSGDSAADEVNARVEKWRREHQARSSAPRPRLNPDTAAAMRTTNLSVGKVDVLVTEMDHKGDPKRSGDKIAESMGGGLEDMLRGLGSSIGAT